jgi:uncharacterized protein
VIFKDVVTVTDLENQKPLEPAPANTTASDLAAPTEFTATPEQVAPEFSAASTVKIPVKIPAQSLEENRFDLARASLQNSLERYQTNQNQTKQPSGAQADIAQLNETLDKLDRGIYCIAAFGLVSRGKSAVLNALIGETVLAVGPLNGVTKFPRSVRWQPDPQTQIDLIDTPGLDEINGEIRGQMAQEIASKADLILFIIAGDITKLEYQALCELRTAQKPLLLVFNKSDLYPEQERQTIYTQLQNLGNEPTEPAASSAATATSEMLHRLLSADEVVMVAADPAAMQVRTEYPDGTNKSTWEKPAPQIDPLKAKILNLLTVEGPSLLAINALVQARYTENSLAETTLTAMASESQQLVWRFAQYKALAIALNPIVFFDVVVGIFIDLIMVRSLAKLYNLPITGYQTNKPIAGVLFSGASLLLAEIFTALVFGVGRGDNLLDVASFSWAAVPGYFAGGIFQGAIGGYGAYAVGKAAQAYLAQGSTWGRLGANTIMREILKDIDSESIVARLRDELIALPVTELVAEPVPESAPKSAEEAGSKVESEPTSTPTVEPAKTAES